MQVIEVAGARVELKALRHRLDIADQRQRRLAAQAEKLASHLGQAQHLAGSLVC